MALSLCSVRTADLDGATRQAIVRLCTAAHEEDFGLLFTLLPPDGVHFLGYIDAELVGHAVVTARRMQPEGLPRLRTAYVDAVATAPPHQGQGIGSAVMHALAGGIAGYEIAGLQTERVSFYARLGWEVWRGPLAGRQPDGSLIPTPAQRGVMILRLPHTPVLNLDGLLTIEHQGVRIW